MNFKKCHSRQSQTPAVTVLLSVFNGERWLSESIKSVLSQTFTDFEFIIVNDGSTDNSLTIIRQFSEMDSRICVYDKPNTGLADSLNYGIERARGEWIARIDADDICVSMRLDRQLDIVSSDPTLVLVGSGLCLLDQNGVKGKVFRYPEQHKSLVKRLTRGGPFFAHSSALFKTNLVRGMGGYRGRVLRAEDHDLWLRLSEVGRIGCVKEPLVFIRKHIDQISHDEGGKRQMIDSYVAMICYWLRDMNCQDPVHSYSDSAFNEFHAWVKKRLSDEGLFEIFALVEELKRKNFFVINSRIISFYVLLFTIITSSRKTARWLRARFLKSVLSKQLANEWAAISR